MHVERASGYSWWPFDPVVTYADSGRLPATLRPHCCGVLSVGCVAINFMQQRVLEQPLEWLRERDREPCLALLSCKHLEPLEVLADLEPLRRILLLRLLGRWRRN